MKTNQSKERTKLGGKEYFTNCDGCPEHRFNLQWQTAWGKPLTPVQEKINKELEAKSQVEFCEHYARYFNKSFPKRKIACQWAQDEYALEEDDIDSLDKLDQTDNNKANEGKQ